jgi:thioesterase domain-containing protein
VLYLQPLAAALGRQHPLYALQTPGLHGEADTPDTVEALAALHVAALRDIQPHGSYHLAGHSSGGRVAFEMARQLEQAGHTVALLTILDTTAPLPDAQHSEVPDTEEGWLDQLVQVFEELGGVDLQIRPGELAVLGDTEAAYARVLQALQQRELVFTAQDTTESLRRWVRVYRATAGGHDSYCSEQCCRRSKSASIRRRSAVFHGARRSAQESGRQRAAGRRKTDRSAVSERLVGIEVRHGPGAKLITPEPAEPGDRSAARGPRS